MRGAKIERWINQTDFENDEAIGYLADRLNKIGVEDALRKAGAREGAQVTIGDISFEDSVLGPLKWDEFNNTVGSVYIREVQEVDGKLYNVPIKEFPAVDQWLGLDPEESMARESYSQSFQG